MSQVIVTLWRTSPEGIRAPMLLVKCANGDNVCNLQTSPSKGDIISFARRAWEVVEVFHVHNAATRGTVFEVNRPDIASYSYK